MRDRMSRHVELKQRRRRWAAFIVFLFFLLVAGSHRVSTEYRILNIGYEKADAAKLNRELREQGERYEVEIAAAKDIERASKIAKRHYQMRYPLQSERVVVKTEER
tara:strand:+ start:230 stop:547 length:318 start_codon:yes stop_codon:yes gene_type:complete